MSNEKDILFKWLDDRADVYKGKLDSRGQTASGNSKRKTKVIKRPLGGAIEVPLYNKGLVQGRKPNSKQDDESLRKWVGWAGSTFLKDWCNFKGIEEGAAFAIAWKIAMEGTTVPNRFNDGNLVNETITPESIKQLTNDLGAFYIKEIKSDIQTIWQQ